MATAKKTAAKKAVRKAKEHVSTRLDAATLARVDALIAKHSTRWVRGTRASMIRALVLEGLPILEAKPPKGVGA